MMRQLTLADREALTLYRSFCASPEGRKVIPFLQSFLQPSENLFLATRGDHDQMVFRSGIHRAGEILSELAAMDVDWDALREEEELRELQDQETL